MKSTTDMTIEQQLRHTWKQERRFCHLRGLGRCVIWLTMLVLVGLLIDWGLLFKTRMPAAVSVLLGIAGLATMVWVVWRDWLSQLRPFDATRIAVEVEEKNPELMSSLVSYTQLDSLSSQSNVSPELLDAMRDFAVQKSHQLKFSDIVDFSQVKKLLAYAAIVLLVAGGASVRWSEHFGAMFKRMAGIDTSYPIQTRLVEISGDIVVPFGKIAEIDITAGGVIPDDAILHVMAADGAGDWNELPMEKLANGATFRRGLEAPDRDMRYFVTMGDFQSAEFNISVVRAPRVVKAELQLHFPEYLKRPPETTDQLNLEVPEGTRIEWNLQCDKPVGKLGVVHGDQRLDAKVDKKNVTFSMTADRRFTYTFEWTEGGSGKSFQFEDVEYSVRVLNDSVPRIGFDGKAPNGPATLSKKAEISWQAKDDHGLDKIWLVYAVTTPGASETPKQHRTLLRDVKGGLGDDNSHTWEPAKSIPGLAPGQQISYHLEATDLRPDESGKRIARSPVRQLAIVTNADYMDWFRRELGTRNEAVKATFLSERDVSKKIKKHLSAPKGDQP